MLRPRQLARCRARGADLSRSTDQEAAGQSLYPVRAAYRTVTGRGPDPTPMLAAFAPDIVHIHNVVPNIGVDWAKRWPGPIVHTIHNYRPLCSNANLFRDGEKCTQCPDGKPLSRHRARLLLELPGQVHSDNRAERFRGRWHTPCCSGPMCSSCCRNCSGTSSRGTEWMKAKMVVIPNGLPEAPGEGYVSLIRRRTSGG